MSVVKGNNVFAKSLLGTTMQDSGIREISNNFSFYLILILIFLD